MLGPIFKWGLNDSTILIIKACEDPELELIFELILTVVLEKTPESPLDCKEIQPVHSNGDQSWVFFGRNDAKAETPVLWPPHVKS